METIEFIESPTGNTEILNEIKLSDLPDELKSHFSDIIKIFYHGVAESNRAKQAMQILDELNLAKREFCNRNNLSELPAANELIHSISEQLFKNFSK